MKQLTHVLSIQWGADGVGMLVLSLCLLLTSGAAAQQAATQPTTAPGQQASEAADGRPGDDPLPPGPMLATDLTASDEPGPALARIIDHLRRRGLYRAITRPSEDRRLSLIRPGQIASVHVEEGDTVEAGRRLIELDNAAEAVALARLQAAATDTVRVEAADARLAQSRVDLQRTRDAFERGGATQGELDRAELDVLIAELSLELAEFEHQQEGFNYREAQAAMDRMRMHSPIDGVVERLLKHEGESVEAHEEIVRIIAIDPLEIDVPTPEIAAGRIAIDDRAWVWLPGLDEPRPGRVTYRAAEADAASNTRIVRVAVDNPDARAAGQHVYVNFGPEPVRPVLPENLTRASNQFIRSPIHAGSANPRE